ncbi:hypothetical protein M8494_18485 [Serratia ureilytica]
MTKPPPRCWVGLQGTVRLEAAGGFRRDVSAAGVGQLRAPIREGAHPARIARNAELIDWVLKANWDLSRWRGMAV